MRKKRFLAIVAAIAISMSFTAPVTISATEVEGGADTTDDEQADGEQTTIAAPDADDDTDDRSSGAGNSSSGTSNGSSGTSGGSGSTGTSSGSTGTTGTSSGTTKSSDSSLAHLGIAPGSLSPAFSAGTYTYTASVDANTTAISVAARPNSSKAVIAAVSGAKSLRPGSNTVKVIVEAENGATSTYTITVNCGAASVTAQPADQTQTDTPEQSADEPTLEGEISAIEDTEDTSEKRSEVTFDDNGYLIYEGNAYLPSSMMPEGEYVSLDKYNKLYEQQQTQKTKNMRWLILCIVIIVLLLIVILNLAFKLKDARQDAKLGLNGIDDEEDLLKKKRGTKEERRVKDPKPTAGTTDTSMIPDVKMPAAAKPSKPAAKPAKPAGKAEKPVRTEKPAASKPAKPAKAVKKTEDPEILDLNDL